MSLESVPPDRGNAGDAGPLALRVRRQLRLLAVVPVALATLLCAALFVAAEGDAAEALRRLLLGLVVISIVTVFPPSIVTDGVHPAPTRAPSCSA